MTNNLKAGFLRLFTVAAAALWLLTALAWPVMGRLFFLFCSLKVAAAAYYGTHSAWLAAGVAVVSYVALLAYVKEYRPQVFSR